MKNVVSKAYNFLRKPQVGSDMQETDQSKRSFIGGIVGAAGLTIAPGVMLYETASAKPADQAVTNAVRWGMLVDTLVLPSH